MAKTKTPLLGLGARGTIGDALTFQRRNKATMVRQKPIPTDVYSLPQAYQRWLYRDYAYLWPLLTPAQRQVWQTKASRYHITGYNLYLRDRLKNWPDIGAYWKMDDNLGTTTIDSSPNANTATIIGASPATGVIDRCFYFDGINDLLTAPHSASLSLATALTIEVWVKLASYIPWQGVVEKRVGAITNYVILFFAAGKKPYFDCSVGGVAKNTGPAATPELALNIWYHLCATFDGTTIRFYIDGQLVGIETPTGGNLDTNAGPVRIGAYGAIEFDGNIDNLIIYNRCLDDTERLRHIERRYPA